MIPKFKPPILLFPELQTYIPNCLMSTPDPWKLGISNQTHSKLSSHPSGNLAFLLPTTAGNGFTLNAQSKTLVSSSHTLYWIHQHILLTLVSKNMQNLTTSHYLHHYPPRTGQYDAYIGRILLWGISSHSYGGWEVLWSAVERLENQRPENKGS